VTPILVRPVREQLEHDRVIRLLQARWRRRYQVGINPGIEQNVGVGTGDAVVYPDVVLMPLSRGRRPQVVIEVETAESVNSLEALSQWARLAQERAAFHLYVPSGSVEAARRFCEDNSIAVDEIWTFHSIGEQMRFTMVYRAPAPSAAATRRESASRRARPKPASRPKRAARRQAAKPVRKQRPVKAARKPARARRKHK
jgi:hypothetical protein